ncbi:hypothetical protein JQ604_38600 [Bradyrhizobium jicamae]|uniref:hypothetical protein n=1 Tax=Bradyrhizobium jicamae TaxID=280332 RepID=UPI001BA6CCEB|nr:hypothetical protein [Bradyrhizobium jicamae]MBR0758126.1 hypothetical protein [Bradyrhizobium jicamae]
MLDIDQSEVLDGEVLGDETACTDLVPLNPVAAQWAPKRPLNHPDTSFITQLIATAEQVPQTRNLRRGSYADAQSAYGPHVGERRSVARRTRQII